MLINNFIVDFYCHELKLAIEIDGSSHDDKVDYDKERQKTIEGFGVTFIRFTNNEVKRNVSGVIYSLESKVRELHHPADCFIDILR